MLQEAAAATNSSGAPPHRPSALPGPEAAAPRYFREEPLERIRNAHYLAATLYPDAGQFLERLPVSSKMRQVVYPLVVRDGPQVAFLKTAIADLLGIGSEKFIEYWRDRAPCVDELLKIFDRLQPVAATGLNYGCWMYKTELPEACAGQVLQHPARTGREGRVTLFPAAFHVFPARYMRHGLHSGSEASIFAVYLPERDFQRVVLDAASAEFDHVDNCFAFKRFYKVEGCYIEADTQSDWYGRLRTRELKAKYRDWAKVLQLGFEDYVRDQLCRRIERPRFKQLAELDRYILVPDSDLMGKRWPRAAGHDPENDLDPIAPSLARILYEERPATLEYRKIPFPAELTFPERDPLGREVRSQMIWAKEAASFMEVDQTSMRYIARTRAGQAKLEDWFAERRPREVPAGSPLQVQFEAVINREPELHGRTWRTLYEKLFPLDFFQQVGEEGALFEMLELVIEQRNTHISADRFHYRTPERDHTPDVLAAFDSAPLIQLPLAEMPGATPALLQVQERILARAEYRPVLDALSPQFSFFSRGVAGGVSGAWWNIPARHTPGWHLTPLHIEDQNRHPTLRFLYYGPNRRPQRCLSVGAKGGGLRSDEGQKLLPATVVGGKLPLYLDSKVVQALMFDTGADDQAPLMLTHLLWGGLMKMHAKPEMLNMLGALQLMQHAAPDLPPTIAVPLDLGVLPLIPVHLANETLWISTARYLSNFLKLPEITPRYWPCCLRSISPCDVRLSQIVNRVFKRDENSAHNLDLCRQQVESALQFFYWVNGRQFTPPAQPLTPRGNQLGPAEVMEYLRNAGELNRSEAEQLRAQIVSGTLRTMAAVHGAGGHLGGAWLGTVGAVSGGAMGLRNIDGAGIIHDLDPDVFLPWIQREDMPLTRQVEHRSQLPLLQCADAMYWRDAVYWLDNLLFGGAVPADQPLTETTVGRYNRFLRFGALEEEYRALFNPDAGAAIARDYPAFLHVQAEWERELYLDCYRRGRDFS